jgi:hypothetical protein
MRPGHIAQWFASVNGSAFPTAMGVVDRTFPILHASIGASLTAAVEDGPMSL